MKKSLILLTSALAMLAMAAAPGCSGGGDDDDDDDDDDGSTLASGTYAATVNAPTTTCTDDTFTPDDSFYAGSTEADVTATATSFDIEFDTGFATTYDITGTDLLDPSSPGDNVAQADFSDPAVYQSFGEFALSGPVDCVLNYSENYRGDITGTNEFTLHDDYEYTIGSGAACNALVTSGLLSAVPCAITDSVDLAL